MGTVLAVSQGTKPGVCAKLQGASGPMERGDSTGKANTRKAYGGPGRGAKFVNQILAAWVSPKQPRNRLFPKPEASSAPRVLAVTALDPADPTPSARPVVTTPQFLFRTLLPTVTPEGPRPPLLCLFFLGRIFLS